MPDSRKADFNLGCLEVSVFLDFNSTTNNRINLCRISFDGYGCCDFGNNAKFVNDQSSQAFIHELAKENLDEEKIKKIVFDLIRLIKDNIWTDALEEYNLVDKG